MGTLAALLQTLGGVGTSYSNAKQELSEESIKKKQIYSQLETAALQRDHLKQIMRLAEGNPQAKQIADVESAIGRKLTDVEKQRFFSVAPKETAGKVVTKLEQDKNSKTGWSFVSYDPISGQEYSRQMDAPPQRGLIESETDTKDPLTGLHTITRRKPIIGPLGGNGKSPTTAPIAAPVRPQSPLAALTTPPPGQPQLAGRKRGAGPLAKRSDAGVEGLIQPGNVNLNGRPVLQNPDGTISSEQSFSIGTDKGEVLLPLIVNGKRLTQQQAIDHYRQTGEHMGIFDTPAHADAYATKVHNRRLTSSNIPLYTYRGGAGALSKRDNTSSLPLDADGHIPPSASVNPYVRETANELLDGKDMDKVKYSKLIPVASELARKYGWEQGKFTPREQVMLRETSTFIQRAMQDDSMKALDEGGMSRLRLQQIAQNPDKEGFIGRVATLAASSGMTDSQKKFLQTYNQLVGTISGMAQLVRSGRATEATIERLKAELPNPTNTKDSKDARERLQRLMDEINVAMQKGSFTDSGNAGSASDPAQQLINRILKGGQSNASPR